MNFREISEVIFCINQCKNKNKQTRKDPKYKKLLKGMEDLYNKEFSKFYIESDKYYYNGEECVITKHEATYCHIVIIRQNGFGYKNTSKFSCCAMYSELKKDNKCNQ